MIGAYRILKLYGVWGSEMLDCILWLDRLAVRAVGEIRNPCLDVFFLKLTILGSPLLLMLMGELLALYWLKHRKYLQAVFINFVLITTWILIYYLKIMFGRSRPTGEVLSQAFGCSLPSGHAMLSLCFYGFCAFLLLEKWPGFKGRTGAAILGVLISLVGASRVYLNVHYLSDVLAGYFFGGILLWLFIRIFRRLRQKN